MAAKKGLGRGLDALLGEYTAAPKGTEEVDIYLIDPNTEQPRKSFDKEKLHELAESIRRHGMVQPIIVRQNGERFTVVAGERRYRAARIAGLNQVPVLVKNLEDKEVMEVALVENIQRENLNPIEEAAAIRFLMQQHDLTQEEVSKRLSKSRPAIANTLRLLTLPASVQGALKEGMMQSGHARVLAGMQNDADKQTLAQEIVELGLSVRQTEQRAKEMAEGPKQKPAPAKKPQDNDLHAAEKELREKLGTKVSILGNPKRGKVVIEYFSKQELQEIYDLLAR